MSRHIILGCLAFIVLLCVTMGIIGFLVFRNSMMRQYESHIRDIMNLTMARIDVDDLEQCIDSNEPTEGYQELTRFMDQARQNYALDYLVIVSPVKDGEHYDVMQVASGLLEEERNGKDLKDIAVPQLGDMMGDFYPPDFIPIIYDDMINHKGIKFSTSSTEFGRTYDGATSIRTADGRGIALLTAGITLNEIDATLRRFVLITTLCGVAITILFLLFMTYWLRKRVILPLKLIEETAGEFVIRSQSQKDPEALVLSRPDIHTGDELESLADTLVSMSENMKSYVEDLLSSTEKIEGLQQEMSQMNRIVYKDALTGVKNKAAYDKAKNRLNWDILNHMANFGILMIDLNYLKRVNDTFGHEKGDMYIINACDLICTTFVHSPVYRVGGDEFVVLLENRDLNNAKNLVNRIREKIEKLRNDQSLEGWERVSAALGVAFYNESMDEDADDVLKRADKAMYENKKAMKAVRTD